VQNIRYSVSKRTIKPRHLLLKPTNQNPTGIY